MKAVPACLRSLLLRCFLAGSAAFVFNFPLSLESDFSLSAFSFCLVVP